MDLKTAIASLEPTNDAHWTESGLPQLSVIKELTGEHYSRKEVTDAAPLVTRERLLAEANTEVQPPAADVAADPEVKVDTAEEAPAEAPADSLENVKAVIAELEAEAGALDQEATALMVEITKLTNQHTDLINKRDGLMNKRDGLLPKITTTHHIQEYLATQTRLRESREPRAGVSDLDRRLMTRARAARPPKA